MQRYIELLFVPYQRARVLTQGRAAPALVNQAPSYWSGLTFGECWVCSVIRPLEAKAQRPATRRQHRVFC